MLPEFPSAARVSEYVCDLEYLFSRMNVGSYGATEPHLWLISKIPTRTWDDCRATSERKSRTHSYDDVVDLLIELALERDNDSHMEKFFKKHLGRGGTPTPKRGEGKGPKNPTNANQGGGKGRGNLRAINEVKSDAGTPILFYCKPVNDKGGPCHAPDCDHRSNCMLQMKRQQHTKDGKTVTHQDHFRCTITCGYCGKRRHYEDKCHIKNERVTNTSDRRLNARRTKHPPETPRMGIKVVKEVAKGVAKVDPLTPRGAHQRPLLLLGLLRGVAEGQSKHVSTRQHREKLVNETCPWAPFAATPPPAEGDPKKRPQADNASPEGNNSKKRRLAWMAKSLMAAGLDVKFPAEE